MKVCTICNKEHERKTASTCLPCGRKLSARRWIAKNKEKFNQYQNQYRQENRKLCQKRSKLSRIKKIDYYLQKSRENYFLHRNMPLDTPRKKRKAGEGNIDCHGYKTITKRGHPNAMDDKGRIREHVFIMAQHLGRPLRKGESVHHKNGDRLDNRIENLELWCKFQPPGQRVEDKVKCYIEFLESYGYKIVKI